MLDLISVGDSTIDTFIQIHDAEVNCDIDSQNCKICLNYGEKIPVDKLVHLVAGNAANNAVGSSRLKLKTAIYTNVGSDSSGKEIMSKLKAEGVQTQFVKVNHGLDSNYSAVLSFKGERTIFVYHQQWDYKLPELDKVKWLYFTSTSSSVAKSDLYNDICRYVERTGVRLLFNPGTYQIQAGVKKNPRLLSLTNLIIVNKEEAEKILDLNSTKSINVKDLLKGLVDLGPKMVVITDANKGSYGFDGEDYFKLEAFPADLVEMTGCGDAYATGVVAGLVHGDSLSEAMRWGSANGAAVAEKIGPQEGLLTLSQMEDSLKKNANIKVEKLK